MSRARRRPGRAEAGAATVLVVAMAGVLLFVTVGLSAAGGLVTSQRRAQAAADLAALAAATTISGGDGDPCVEAGRVAAANAADLGGCQVEGSAVEVTVSVRGPRLPGREALQVTAEARAGPG